MRMLFVLTGDVQTGKTRWLERLVDDARAQGVVAEGVLAPGVWRRRAPGEEEGARGLAGAGAFEKLGIDNRLLPTGETLPFARRRDLAQEDGAYDAESQSARAGLGWEISDAAIARVNAHFDELARRAGAGSAAGADVASGGLGDSAAPGGSAAPVAVPLAAPVADLARGRFLVVDELGPLEIMRGGGLTSALALLDAGPTMRYPHALIVVRAWLVDAARERFEPAWGCVRAIAPDDADRMTVFRAWGLRA